QTCALLISRFYLCVAGCAASWWYRAVLCLPLGFIFVIKRCIDLLIRPISFTHQGLASIKRCRIRLIVCSRVLIDQVLFGDLQVWFLGFGNHSYSFRSKPMPWCIDSTFCRGTGVHDSSRDCWSDARVAQVSIRKPLNFQPERAS